MRLLLLVASLVASLSACTTDSPVGKTEVDGDNDGYDDNVDCNDADNDISPDAVEICDDVDNDCDGAVDDDDDDATDAPTWYADDDGDTFGDAAAATVACDAPAGTVADATDCDDAEGRAFPGNAEVCDGIDNDCDGAVDDDDDNASGQVVWYADVDDDGYGDPATSVTACEAPPGYVADDTDCDDTRDDVFPSAPETDCADPTDYNCDGSVQYADADRDGFPACQDCDDAAGTVNPGAAEVCDDADVDEDCDGDTDDEDASVTGTTDWYRDRDGDGYAPDDATAVAQCEAPAGYVDLTGDCDDYDDGANPGETEVCDALDTDEDCDGLVDDDDPSTSAASWSTWYADRDGDAYGDASRDITQCDQPSGYVANDDDCDDTNAARSPGAAEVCDAADLDEDCDGAADDDDSSVTGGGTYYRDADSDGYGSTTSRNACDLPAGYVANDDDCNDASASISPADAEVCDAADTDEDCDGLVDDADGSVTGRATWYRDADSDAYGAAASATSACDQPSGYVANDDDCNDGSAGVSPADVEVCDGADVDEDCDGLADDADASVTGGSTWYRDGDSDGYGTTTTTVACTMPAGYVANDDDCNDASASVSPADAEVCDGANVDEDCDGLADDADGSATGQSTWYRDADGDTYGNAAVASARCDTPAGYVANDDDCDDTNAGATTGGTWYRDADGDGYGTATTTSSSCAQPAGYVANASDCNDGNGSVGAASTWYRDADSDGYGISTTTTSSCTQPSGYVAVSTDCNDSNATISPGDPEVCDAGSVDEDCDGLADDADSAATGKTTWYLDADGDTYGDASTAQSSCDEPSGYVTNATDCLDSDATANPDGTETCDDGIDQDCSGADEACTTGGYAGTYDLNTGYSVKLYGDTSGNLFGESLVAGDFNGDGAGDLVVGAPYASAGSYDGIAYVYYGPLAAGVSTASAVDGANYYTNSSSFDNNWPSNLFNVGYVNSDAIQDIGIQVTVSNAYGFLFYGGDTSSVPYTSVDLGAGYCRSLATAGDFNATSGTDEWACGAQDGNTYVYSGTSTSSAVATIYGESTSDWPGLSVAGDGDVDGDGYDDLWIGAPYNDAGGSDGGAAYLVYAPISGSFGLVGADAKVHGSAGDNFGYIVRMAGDVDGDGYADLLGAAPTADPSSGTNAGCVYLFTDVTSGSYGTGTSAAVKFFGEDANDAVGYRDVEFGDVNGDGEVDYLFGASANDDYATNAGAAWLVYGPVSGNYTLGTDSDAEWLGDTASDAVGRSVAIIPDWDGDGDDEIAIGANAGDERGYVDHGAVWIWEGS